MSSLNAKLNVLVVLVIAGALAYAAFRPMQPPPPTEAWFASAINRSQPVLVKFGAEWCPPCQMLEAELDRIEGGPIAVVRVNVDEHPELARHYHVSSIPRLMLFQEGQLLADRVGYADHEELQHWATAHCRQ